MGGSPYLPSLLWFGCDVPWLVATAISYHMEFSLKGISSIFIRTPVKVLALKGRGTSANVHVFEVCYVIII